MRRIVIATLVLIPVLAQASPSTKPSPSSATLLATATPPAAPAPAHNSAAATDAATSATTVPVNIVIRQAVPVDVDASGTISYSFGGGSSSIATLAPLLIHAVPAELTPQEIAVGSDVTVRLTVDRNGVPQNISVDHATNPAVARKTIAAVSQYRFKPATRDYMAVPFEVTLDVKISNQ